MNAGAIIDGNKMKVSLTMNVNQTIGSNHKLACVLVEDSVTGQDQIIINQITIVVELTDR